MTDYQPWTGARLDSLAGKVDLLAEQIGELGRRDGAPEITEHAGLDDDVASQNSTEDDEEDAKAATEWAPDRELIGAITERIEALAEIGRLQKVVDHCEHTIARIKGRR